MPPIQLKSITFTRQPDGPGIPILDALGGRRPSTDWRRTDDGIHSRAVALPRTAPSISIDVEFDVAASVNGSTRVRAREITPSPLGNVLTEQIPAGELGDRPHRFQVQSAGLANQGVTATSVTWQWEWSDGGGEWQPFDQSQHDLFVLLDTPAAPWTTSRLWREVLDRACLWAAGARTFNQCTEAIVSGIYELGGQAIAITNGSIHIGYDEASKFSRGERAYDLAAFLDTAAARPGSENMMNCTDCAGATALLSAALGCDLRVVLITPGPGTDRFHTNPVKLIGGHRRNSTTFLFHTVNCTVDGLGQLHEKVWDACLMLDVARGAAETFKLATGMRRHATTSQAGYEPQLIAASQPAVSVTLNPGHGIVRPVPVQDDVVPVLVPGSGPAPEPDVFLVAEPDRPVFVPPSSQAILIRDNLFREARMSSASEFMSRGARFSLSIARLPSKSTPGHYLHAWLITAENSADARSIFKEMAATVSSPMFELKNVCDAALACEDARAVLMLRGHTVIRLVNDDEGTVDLTREARALDAQLVAITPSPQK